jgi:hypothetical protein
MGWGKWILICDRWQVTNVNRARAGVWMLVAEEENELEKEQRIKCIRRPLPAKFHMNVFWAGSSDSGGGVSTNFLREAAPRSRR